jgi:transcriptional regulator with XRE-family HTH domain
MTERSQPSTPLGGLGAALRRLRMARGLRQYEAAEKAGVTKAMLSAYETGKRRPSLKTLDSLLTAIGVDLGDLHRALTLERRRAHDNGAADLAEPPALRYDAAWEEAHGRRPGAWFGGPRIDLHELLGIDHPLPPEEELALSEMLHGFLKLLRFMHRETAGEGGARGPFDS